MSLIGPRPELVRYTNQYEGEEKDILKVRPGITDFSSVEFINLDEIVGGENADEMYEKYNIVWNMYYISDFTGRICIARKKTSGLRRWKKCERLAVCGRSCKRN